MDVIDLGVIVSVAVVVEVGGLDAAFSRTEWRQTLNISVSVELHARPNLTQAERSPLERRVDDTYVAAWPRLARAAKVATAL